MRLQRWEHSPHTPIAMPTGKDYEAAVALAEKAGPEALLALLDAAAIQTGQSRWSDDHLDALGAADRKTFKKHYDQVLSALTTRRTYLQWLVGAVCNTPAGLKRAIEVATTGTETARLAASAALVSKLKSPADKKAFAAAMPLETWDGKGNLEKVFRAAVRLLNVGGSERAGYCEHAKVVFTKPGTTLVRHEVPDDFADVIYQACAVTLHPTLSLPSPTNPHATKALKGAALERYENEVFDAQTPLPRVFGYRDHGSDAEEPRTAQLLLQLPGDTQSDMEFGDVEALSFFIDQKALAKADFSKVWPRLGD